MAAGRAGDGGLRPGCGLIRGPGRRSGVTAETFRVFARSNDRARWASVLLIFGRCGCRGRQAAGSARIRASAAR